MPKSERFVRKTGQRLETLSGTQVREMLSDYLYGKTDRYSESAIEEFLNVNCTDGEAEAIRQALLALERSLFDAGDEMGLRSCKARQTLEKLAEAGK